MNDVKRDRVLIVDDEDYARELLISMLEEMGFEAVIARDGFEGLDVFSDAAANFRACIVDLNMPGMAGLELLDLIRERDTDVPVLLVSGYSRHEVRQKEAKSGNVSFLQKPFTRDQFQSAFQARLAG